MIRSRFLCAALSHSARASVLAITFCLACGGQTVSQDAPEPTGERTRADGGGVIVDASAPTACPSNDQIAAGSALGASCSKADTYCPDTSCDPCVEKSCRAVRCVDGQWTIGVNSATCVSPTDASAACTTIDTTGYDQSCQTDSDCVTVSVGSICENGGSCMCTAGSIRASEKDRFDAHVAAVEAASKPGGRPCSCPYFGSPKCVAKQCMTCGGAVMCPDAG